MSNMSYSRRSEAHVVYRFFDEADRLLYVGCTIDFGRRLSEHRKKSWFHYPPTIGTARKHDRPTSVAAARSVLPGPDQQRCLDALRANGGQGTIDTVCEHFARLGLFRDRGPLSRRLTDLADASLIGDTGRTERGSRGRDVTVWAIR